MYRIYIQDRESRLWLLDWIVSIGMDHPQFTANRENAMKFDRFEAAMKYHRCLTNLGYTPHIE